MKSRHLLALLQTGFTTIQVEFVEGEVKLNTEQRYIKKQYTYKARLDDNLVVDDYAVVMSPTRGLALVQVKQVDKVPKIDVDAPWTYKWIVQKVDLASYNAILAQEQQFEEAMLEVERTQQREALLKQYTEGFPEGSQARQLFENATSTLIHIGEIRHDAT